MPGKLPSHAEMQRQVGDLLAPALALGLVNHTGPLIEEDRRWAREFLRVTETREAFAAFLRQKAVAGAATPAVLSSPELRRILGLPKLGPEPDSETTPRTEGEAVSAEQTPPEDVFAAIAAQLQQLQIPSVAGDITDEVWRYAQARRKYAEQIANGVIPAL